jgi:hypothetical protein
VVAGLERDVEVRAAGARSGPGERGGLGVPPAGAAVEPLADDAAAADHDRSHHRVGRNPGAPALGELDRPIEEVEIDPARGRS